MSIRRPFDLVVGIFIFISGVCMYLMSLGFIANRL